MTKQTHPTSLILFTLSAIQFTHIVDFMVIMPLGPHFLNDLHIHTQQFSMLVSAYTISAGISGFIASFILDQLNRKKALISVLVGFAIGTLCCALSHGFWMLFLARIVTGSFGGILASLTLAILGDTFPPEQRGKAMGIVMSAFSLASIIGVPFGLFLANRYTWEAPFYVLTLLGFLILIPAIKFIPKTTHTLQKNASFSYKTHIETLKSRLKNTNQLTALSLTMVLMLGQFSVIPLISTYMVTNVGFSYDQLTFIYIFGGIASFIMAPLSGRLSDKFGQKPLFLIFSLCCTIPLIGITHLTRQSMLIPLCFTTLLFALSSSRMVCGMALILSSTTAKNRAGFMSLNSCVQQLSAGIAAFVSGLIVTQSSTGELHHYSVVGYLAATTSIIAIFVAYRISMVSPTDESTIEEQEMTELLLS